MPESCCCADEVLSTWQVIVFHGETISAWRRQGYHESGEHASFRELLNAPKEDAHMLLQERFPVPMYVECDQYGSQARLINRFIKFLMNRFIKRLMNRFIKRLMNRFIKRLMNRFINEADGSQARFLLAKLNPSVTHNSTTGQGSDFLFTDDVSLQVFMEHLKKLAVQS